MLFLSCDNAIESTTYKVAKKSTNKFSDSLILGGILPVESKSTDLFIKLTINTQENIYTAIDIEDYKNNFERFCSSFSLGTSNSPFLFDLISEWTWESIENTSFSLYNFNLPTKNADIQLSISELPSNELSLSIESNVNRWRRQLNLFPISFESINNQSNIGVSKLGTFYYWLIIK
tara:strand:- start:23 stop:550 length:528 start_codon:yes stop_codon:yes gene_type:complete